MDTYVKGRGLMNGNEAPAGNGTADYVKRRKKFIRRDLQLKLIFGTFFVALISMCFSLMIPIIGMWMLQGSWPDSFQPFYTRINNLLIFSLGISIILSIPVCFWMGIVISFHFCGPLYKIKKHFTEMLSGRWDTPCQIRKTMISKTSWR